MDDYVSKLELELAGTGLLSSSSSSSSPPLLTFNVLRDSVDMDMDIDMEIDMDICCVASQFSRRPSLPASHLLAATDATVSTVVNPAYNARTVWISCLRNMV